MALNIELDTKRFLKLLGNLIGETEHLQNNPMKFIPEEDRAIKHVVDLLGPHSTENGGPLKLDHATYVEGRGNLIVEYIPEGAEGTVAFVGSHLDVVPATPETWDRNPFKLTVEGDQLFGRGTTDCLGHVALLTEMFIQLAEKKPKLKTSVVAVFIASEESSVIPNVGVDMLMKDGKLDHLKGGPIYWVDSSDSQPCMGTASAAMWKMTFNGRLFHSGLPHKGINSIELAMDAITYIQTKFYEDYPPHPEEERYKFEAPSTMKPTQVKCSEGSINQLPAWTEMQGDIRLTPFYDIYECQKKIQGYVDAINADLTLLPTRGPCSRYELDLEEGQFRGEIILEWQGEPFRGIACDIDSPAFGHLHESTKEVLGESNPYSITGSLPLVKDMQEEGFDIQICGYGHSSVYHGDNEYCTLSHMQNAIKILSRIVDRYNQ